MRSLAAKILMALAAVAVPALAVAAFLGWTLISTVSEVERDVETALSAARRVTDIRVMMEKENGLVARLPAELDQAKVEEYIGQVASLVKKIEEAVDLLGRNHRIVAPEALAQIRGARAAIIKATGEIANATKSFAQSTALDVLNGPFEKSSRAAVVLLDGVTTKVDAVADEARAELKQSSSWAWRLVPAGLIAVVLAIGLALWIVRRTVVKPLGGLVREMGKLTEGDFDVVLPGLGRKDEIGQMARGLEAFKLKAAEKAAMEAAEKEAAAKSVEAIRRSEMRKLADDFESAVGSMVGTVSSASVELEAAATSLQNTAEATENLTATVTSASEDASGNVQSVAGSTEELTSSVNEVGRQVQESSQIAAEAVRQAELTDARIAQLSQAASRWRRREADHRNRRTDELARPQCHDRSCQGGRSRSGLRGRRVRGEGACGSDRESNRGNRRANRQHADSDAGVRRRDQGDRQHDWPHLAHRFRHRRGRRAAGGNDDRNRSQPASGRTGHEPGRIEHIEREPGRRGDWFGFVPGARVRAFALEGKPSAEGRSRSVPRHGARRLTFVFRRRPAAPKRSPG